MNKVCLVGRLTRDPEIRYSEGANATAVAKWSTACNRKFKKDGQPDADFINCLAFGKTAEFLEKYFRKGMRIGLEGRIQTGSYTNKDGVKVYTTEVLVEDVEFVENKASAEKSATEASGPSSESGNDFMNIPDGIEEGLPFN